MDELEDDEDDYLDDFLNDTEDRRVEMVDQITFPDSVGGAYTVNGTALTERKATMLTAIEANAKCVEEVGQISQHLKVLIQYTQKNIEALYRPVTQQDRKSITKLESAMTGLQDILNLLMSTIKNADTALNGMRDALIEDIAEGVVPPPLLYKYMRYGLSVPVVCGTCGSQIKGEDVHLTQKDIADFIYQDSKPASAITDNGSSSTTSNGGGTTVTKKQRAPKSTNTAKRTQPTKPMVAEYGFDGDGDDEINDK